MTGAELERLVLQLDGRELDAVVALVAALRAPTSRSATELRAVLATARLGLGHLAAIAAAAEVLETVG